MIIQRRKATEEENFMYYAAREQMRKDTEGLPAVDRIRSMCGVLGGQFYYQNDIGCLMWRPSEDQLYDSWCDENNIAHEIRETVKIGWTAAREFNAPAYSDELKAELKAGAEARQRTPHALRNALVKQYEAKYIKPTEGK